MSPVHRGSLSGDHYNGWSLTQWAEACAWFESTYGWTPFPDHAGAMKVWVGWHNRRNDEPPDGERRIVFSDDPFDLPMNAPWARKLWFLAVRDCRYPPRLRDVWIDKKARRCS